MQYKVEVLGQQIEVQAQLVNGDLWFHHQGRTVCVPAKTTTRRHSKGAAAQGQGGLVAPMPGKITKILKNAGDGVAKGDIVLVMEAMKMEYTLKSATAGQITKLDCQVGQQVTLGQMLVEIAGEKSV